MDEKAQQVLSELVRGAHLAFDNAKELYAEAELLSQNDHPSRALALHQISMEECAKVDIIGMWATNLLYGEEVDFGKLTGAIRNHKAKNFTNAYMVAISDAEQAARDARNWKASARAFKKKQAKIHAFLNSNKNAALYVDLKEGIFVAPTDAITNDLADDIAIVNRYFLDLTENRIGSLTRMLNDRDEMQDIISWFIERIKGMDPETFQSEREAVFDEMIDRYKEKAN